MSEIIKSDIYQLQKLINAGMPWQAALDRDTADKLSAAMIDGLVLLPRSGSHYTLTNGEPVLNRDQTLGPGSYSYVVGLKGHVYADALDEIGEDFLE